MVENGLPLFFPMLKTLGNFLNPGLIVSICIKMFTFEAPLTEHSSNTQLLPSIVVANYRGVRQTGSRTGGGPPTQWLRCYSATWDIVAQWKAVNSFRLASLNPAPWALHPTLPFALPTLIYGAADVLWVRRRRSHK